MFLSTCLTQLKTGSANGIDLSLSGQISGSFIDFTYMAVATI